MGDIAVEVENLSKKFYIGGPQASYKTLKDSISNALTAPFRRIVNLVQGHAYGAAELHEILWALKDVSFNVKQGEVLGIIGCNGAGKSTLLKVLSRITEPSNGQVKLRGRVGSLLEVGTGFNPELTGRENIYLNSAILGMGKREIDRKFDEIVAFSEIEKFIDTPVKYYSSGMYIRLAFAVAAHMEPEILIVDEVLSVGDAAFREKCLGKMNSVAGEGRTVLFVSHNMKAVEILCDRVILLDHGRIILEGEPSEIIQHYLGEKGDSVSAGENADFSFTDGKSKTAQINRIRVFNSNGQLTLKHNVMDSIKIVIDFELRINYPTLFVECVFRKVRGPMPDGGGLLTTNYDWDNYRKQKENKRMDTVFPMSKGKYSTTINMDAPLLNAGVYEMEVYLTTGPQRQDTRRQILFEVNDSGSFASVVRGAERGGFLAFPLKWEVKKIG